MHKDGQNAASSLNPNPYEKCLEPIASVRSLLRGGGGMCHCVLIFLWCNPFPDNFLFFSPPCKTHPYQSDENGGVAQITTASAESGISQLSMCRFSLCSFVSEPVVEKPPKEIAPGVFLPPLVAGCHDIRPSTPVKKQVAKHPTSVQVTLHPCMSRRVGVTPAPPCYLTGWVGQRT